MAQSDAEYKKIVKLYLNILFMPVLSLTMDFKHKINVG